MLKKCPVKRVRSNHTLPPSCLPFFSLVTVTLSGSQHHAGLRKLMNMILLCLCLSLLAAFHNHWGPEHRGCMFTRQQHVFSLNVLVWLLVRMFCEDPMTNECILWIKEIFSMYLCYTAKNAHNLSIRENILPYFSHRKSKYHIQCTFYWNASVKISCFQVKKYSVWLAVFFLFCFFGQGDLVSHTVLSFTQTLPFSHHMWKRKKALIWLYCKIITELNYIVAEHTVIEPE